MNTDMDYQYPLASRFLGRRVYRRAEEATAYASQVDRCNRDWMQQAVDGDKSPAESGDKSPHSKVRRCYPCSSVVEFVIA